MTPGPPPQNPPGANLPKLASFGVIALGIVSFLLGFAPFAEIDVNGELPNESDFNFFYNGGSGVGVVGLALLLAASVIAAFGLAPKLSGYEPVVAGLSIAGFASLLFLLIGLADLYEAGIGLILILVTSFLQAALATFGALLAGEVIKPGPPRNAGYGPPAASWPPQGQGQPYPPQQPPRQGPPQGPPPGQQPPYGAPPPWR